MEKPPAEPDLFTNLPTQESKKGKAVMSIDEIIAESGVMLNAGNDTTQTSLTNTMYFLASQPQTQQKLRQALHEALPQDQTPIARYEDLRHVRYLQAVLDESFRLQAPLGTGLPRITTKETIIDGEVIKSGVTVSAQTWSLHRTESLFHRANEYIPERWLAEGEDTTDLERQNLKEYVLPFSQGPRACIGRNLAYMELSICIAALVLVYEWALPQQKAPLKHHERFNCNPVELMVIAKRVQS
jgi:benzoate 4-monooxygenase